MFRPERMTSTSIIYVRKDVEDVLEALNGFGEFHIDQAAEAASREEFNRSIQTVQQALTNVTDLAKQLIVEKPGLLDLFKEKQHARARVTAENWQALSEATRQEILKLKNQVEAINTSLNALREKNAELNHIRSMLTTMDYMGADLAAMEELKLINVEITSVPHRNFAALQIALAGFPIILHRCYLTKENDFVCLAMPSKIREDVERILKTHHSDIFQIPEDLPHDVSRALEEVEKRLAHNRQEEDTFHASLRKLGEENRANLASWKETTENVLELLRAEGRIFQSGRLATVKGFVPSKKFRALAQKVTSQLKGRALVLENDVIPDDPPTRIRHNRFVKPFEEITRLYGLPHYDELDPTPVIAVTFPLVFGLMFGDVGHGLVLLLGGLTFGKLIKSNQAIKNLCWILAACGVGAIFAGALFGEFFGIELFPPLWFNPFNNVLSFLIFSLIVGVAQITSGLVLEMVNFVLKRDFVDVVLTSVPKIAFYVGSVSLVAVYQLNFSAWLSGLILLSVVPFVLLVFAKPIFSAVSKTSWRSMQAQGEPVSLGERFFESGDLVTRLLSNTFSYTRILALLMAHWALILVTYEVAGLVGSSSLLGLILSGVVVVGGNVFVIALEGLIVFIHALRLHFYEWFSKFYQGMGTEFAPFKQKFIYTEVALNKSP